MRGGDVWVNRQAVMRERVHDRRDEFGGTGVGGEESHVSNTACLVQVTAAAGVCLCRFGSALPGKVDAPRDSRADESETGASQGRLSWSAERQEHNRGEAE